MKSRIAAHWWPADDLSFFGVSLYFLAFSLILLVIFNNNVACLLFGIDGVSWVIGLEVQAVAREPFTQLGVDPLQGNFDAYYPAYREYLLPDALTLAINGGVADKVTTFTAYGVLMVLCTYILARAVGASRTVGVVGGFLFAAIALPTNLTGESWLYGIYNLLPHLAQTVALTLIIVACFWALDRKPYFVMLGLGFAACAAVVLSILSFPQMTILMAPTIALYAGSSLLLGKGWRARLPRLIAAIACMLVPTMLGMVGYTYALATYTAYNFFNSEFIQLRGSLYFASIIHMGVIGKSFVLLGMVGAFYAAFTGSRRLRVFAFTHIIGTFLFQIIAYLVVKLGEGYHGPSPLYFELILWPIMSLFAALITLVAWRYLAATAARSVGWALEGIRPMIQRGFLAAVPLFLVGWNVAVLAANQQSTCRALGFWPISQTPISDRLRQDIAIYPGAPFRGLVATFNGAHGLSSVDWFQLHGNDRELWRKIGNDLRMVGLWRYSIPTLIQYSELISPPYYLLLTEFLSQPAGKQMRSILVLTHPNEGMLKLWGVRFVIADFNPGFGREAEEMRVPGGPHLYLVELDQANLGDYSPTQFRLMTDFSDGLRAMREPNFDGQRTVVSEFPIAGTLVQALNAKLVFQKSGFSVTASSSGRSVLVLPVQYSHCWTVSGKGDPVLFRANLMQLGVSFTGHLDANMEFRFGPILASRCRLQDIGDMERLRIREARGPVKENGVARRLQAASVPARKY
jgi:hypothetical protein